EDESARRAMTHAHRHFWWYQRHTYPWPDQAGDRFARDFTPDDLRPEVARCGIKGTVLIQVLHQVGGETEECLDICKDVDYVRGVVGWLPLPNPAETGRAIERLRARGGKLVGVRHLISNEPDPRWLLQDGVLDSLTMLAAAGIAFDAIPINAAQFESVLEVAQRLPELKIVLNHLGRPPIPEQGWEPWATQIARAAEHRNVSIKLSIGLDIIMRWRWSTDAVRRYSDHVLDLFSPHRVMAASNWPVILLGATYQECWDGITALLAGLPADERRAVLTDTAERTYGLYPTLPLRRENRFRDHAVDALGAVHDLGHVIVDGHARDHVSLLAAEVREALGDEIDGLAHRDLHRLFQVLMQSHHHPMRGGLGTRPSQLHVFADDELKLAAQPGFDRGQIDLAMTLRGVRIASRKQRARRMHRHEQRGARDQILVVHVAGVNAGRTAA